MWVFEFFPGFKSFFSNSNIKKFNIKKKKGFLTLIGISVYKKTEGPTFGIWIQKPIIFSLDFWASIV